MSKIMTVGYVQSALQTLIFASDNLEETQKRTASGLAVSNAADNAGYWSAATNMTSDQSVLGSIGDALNLGASKLDTAYEAVTSSIGLLDEITGQLVTAYEEGTDRDALNGRISSLKENLKSVLQAATFSGDNWLYNSDSVLGATKSIPASFERSVSGAVSLNYLSVDTADTTLIDTANANRGLLTGTVDANALNSDGTTTSRNYYLLDMGSTIPAAGTQIAVSDATTSAELDDMVAVVGQLTDKLNQLASSFGTVSARIDQQTSFVKSLGDVLDEGVGRLVDADMEEESTKLAAYQTQQSLSSQLLSMLNAHQKSARVLFG
jgi:flagellin